MIELFNGDSIEVMKNLPDQSIDLVLTDPPYNLGNFMKGRQTNLKQMRSNYFGAAGWDNLSYDKWSQNMDKFFYETSRIIKKGSAMIIFMAIIKVESIINLAENHGFYYKTTGIWHKLNPMPRNMNLHYINSTEAWVYLTYKNKTSKFNNNGKVLHDFFETTVTPASEKKHGKHPTQKPIKLMEQFIEVLSHKEDVVLDPFMGSGSTGVAAKKLNREFIGIELSKNYFDIAKTRIKGVNHIEQ